MSAVWSIGAAIGPFWGGLAFDITGNYLMAFTTVAIVIFVATVLVTLIKN